MIENIDIQLILDNYMGPWGIKLLSALVIIVVGYWASKIISSIVSRILAKTRLDEILTHFVTAFIHKFLLVLVIIAALNRLGLDTTSLIALIGAAGLAIALSLQDSLKNFASGLMLVIFRPFKVGDYVEAAGVAGTVEKVSIFSSTLSTVDKKELVVPNGLIYNDTIINYSASPIRRIDMVIGIGYDDDLLKAKSIIQDILFKDERILKKPAFDVNVGELGDNSVNFNVRPWVKNSDYWPVLFYLNETIKLTFDQEGISIPFPQLSVHLDKAG